MAAVAPAADQASDLLQKLNLDPKTKTHDAAEVTNKNTTIPAHDRSVTPVIKNIDSNLCYFPSGYTSPYYFGGYDSINDWEDYPRYVNPDGVEMPPGVYGDMYHPGYGYAPYGAYPSPGSPVPAMGHDGQLYRPQHYQYPAPYFQPPSPAPYTPNQAPTSKGEVVSTSVAPDQPPISLDAAKVNTNGGANGTANWNNGPVSQKPSQQNSSLTSNNSYARGALPNGLPSSGYQDPRFSYDGIRSPAPWFDPVFPDAQHRMTSNNAVSSAGSHGNSTSGRSQNLRPLPHLMV